MRTDQQKACTHTLSSLTLYFLIEGKQHKKLIDNFRQCPIQKEMFLCKEAILYFVCIKGGLQFSYSIFGDVLCRTHIVS